jgi:nitroimidazol reductase NimA-like FMN-containing flavoprotein (pyridoxamine 5'-phosphate oxidase superfamily)
MGRHLGLFDYGRFECDSALAYRSAIGYGRIRVVVDDRAFSHSLDPFSGR